MFELVADGAKRKMLDARGCQLDREGQTIQPAADISHQQSVDPIHLQVRPHRPQPIPEQRRRRPAAGVKERVAAGVGRRLQRWHRKLALAAETQSAPTRH